jgi:esterase/lipase superfamily enzyme
MFFVTNRRRSGQGGNKPHSRVRFNLKEPDPEPQFFACRADGQDSYEFLGSQVFFKALQTQSRRNILIFIHGFNVEMPDALESARQLQSALDHQLGTSGKDAVLVVPFIWPAMGGVLDYLDDQDAAKGSAIAYSRLLSFFVKWRACDEAVDCDRRINVLSHSMGNRVLVYGLHDWAHKNGGVPHLFRNVFMAAADVVNETLERGKLGRCVSDSTRNLTVYHASDDVALRSSKGANLANGIASRRLGHNGPEDMRAVARNVYSVDCSDFNNSYDDPLGHGYFLRRGFKLDGTPSEDSGAVLKHLAHAIRRGRVDIPDDARLASPGTGPELRAFVLDEGYGR